MTEEAFVIVARVGKTHGLKGEVSVVPTAEASFSVFEGVDVWFVPPVRNVRASRIRSMRPGPKGVLVSFEGVDDVDTAHSLTGHDILVASSDVPDEWNAAEDDTAHGYKVTDITHGSLGEIVEIIETGANDVWVVHGPLGEVLIPVIDDVVVDIDDDAHAISVSLLPGLLPGEAEHL